VAGSAWRDLGAVAQFVSVEHHGVAMAGRWLAEEPGRVVFEQLDDPAYPGSLRAELRVSAKWHGEVGRFGEDVGSNPRRRKSALDHLGARQLGARNHPVAVRLLGQSRRARACGRRGAACGCGQQHLFGDQRRGGEPLRGSCGTFEYSLAAQSGSVAATSVPPPRPLSISSRPPSAVTRSLIPTSP
jgi:hypothetical protein